MPSDFCRAHQEGPSYATIRGTDHTDLIDQSDPPSDNGRERSGSNSTADQTERPTNVLHGWQTADGRLEVE